MQMYNEEQLPHVTSRVERFLVDSEGHAEGMSLGNGIDVYFRPHLSAAVVDAVHVGDRITVYGVLPIATPMIAAAVIEAAGGSRIVDDELPTRQLWATAGYCPPSNAASLASRSFAALRLWPARLRANC